MSVDVVPIPDEILDEDEQETPRLERVIERFVNAGIAEVRVAIPGVAVRDMDTTTHRVEVRPVMRDIFPDMTQLPQSLPNVPVRYPSGGGFSVTVPIKQGDPVVICFCDRDIRRWLREGNTGNSDITASDRRRHTWNGTYVEPGLEPASMRRAVVASDRVRVGNATTRLEVRDGGKVYLGTDSAEVLTQISAHLGELLDTLGVLTTFMTVSSTATTAPQIAAAALTAIGPTALPAITTNVTAIRALIDQLKV